MPYTELELVVLGGRFSTQRLIEQGNVSVAVARAHESELAKKFPPAKTAELEALIAEIQAKYATQAGAKDDFGTGNVPVTGKIREAKKWLSEIITSADNAYEEEHERRDGFHKSGKLGTSVPKITGRLQVLTALAEKHQADLAEWGVDAKDLAQGRALLAELTAANIAQEEAVKNLPAATKAVTIQKARAYILLKKLARAARDTFKDDPTLAAKLNLDILQRHGHKPGGDDQPATTPAP
jgi:hypothetical protein